MTSTEQQRKHVYQLAEVLSLLGRVEVAVVELHEDPGEDGGVGVGTWIKTFDVVVVCLQEQ